MAKKRNKIVIAVIAFILLVVIAIGILGQKNNSIAAYSVRG